MYGDIFDNLFGGKGGFSGHFGFGDGTSWHSSDGKTWKTGDGGSWHVGGDYGRSSFFDTYEDAGRKSGQDARAHISITFDEAVYGCDKVITLQVESAVRAERCMCTYRQVLTMAIAFA